ncbi:YfiR/HmsC family protein [Mariniflexile sp.]|uniref:YfiR/HmsC family protein n=1 Tax=Mariniflexile sp. TaxID=1979402 RepID=UPI00356440BA
MPERIQAALLSKVIKYNPQISQNRKIKILVVYNTYTQNSKDEFVAGLGNSMDVKAVYPNEIEQNISGANLVYFMSGVQNSNAICKKYKVLSVSGILKHVEHGEISLGFVIQNSKPVIVVNLTSLEKEGQTFSSDILRISKIYK